MKKDLITVSRKQFLKELTKRNYTVKEFRDGIKEALNQSIITPENAAGFSIGELPLPFTKELLEPVKDSQPKEEHEITKHIIDPFTGLCDLCGKDVGCTPRTRVTQQETEDPQLMDRFNLSEPKKPKLPEKLEWEYYFEENYWTKEQIDKIDELFNTVNEIISYLENKEK